MLLMEYVLTHPIACCTDSGGVLYRDEFPIESDNKFFLSVVMAGRNISLGFR